MLLWMTTVSTDECPELIRAQRYQRKTSYDEPEWRMDGRRHGWRHVDFGGDRRSGGGTIGLCDWQAVEKVTPLRLLDIESRQ